MNKSLGCLALAAGLAIVGLAFGLWLADARLSGMSIPWKPVLLPDRESADHFVVAEMYTIPGVVGGALVGMLLFWLLTWTRGQGVAPARARHPERSRRATSLPDRPVGSWIRCERCGKELGPDVLDCPEQRLGHCPYAPQAGAAVSGCMRWIGWPACLFGLLVLGVAFFNPETKAGERCLALPLALGSLTVGAWALAGRRETLHDPTTGRMWQRHLLFGLETDRKVVTRLELVVLNLTLTRPLGVPASILALAMETDSPRQRYAHWIRHATNVLESTLIAMVAQGVA